MYQLAKATCQMTHKEDVQIFLSALAPFVVTDNVKDDVEMRRFLVWLVSFQPAAPRSVVLQ